MNKTKRVLLLNPPGNALYIRDYYCSKSSRTNYNFPPVTLLHAGAIFQKYGWTVDAIDAIGGNLSVQKTIQEAITYKPSAVFCLVGAVSAEEDRMFLKLLRSQLPSDTTIIGCGDILLEGGDKWLQNNILDAIALDFTTDAYVRFAEGERCQLPGVHHLLSNGSDERIPFKAKNISIGIPPHNLFAQYEYHFPFASKTPFASLLVDYGCPFNCSFCVMSTLNYHRRPMAEVAEELNTLTAMGIKEFILWDQTFAAKRKWAKEFLELLPTGKNRFGWTCYTRPDKIDRSLALQMAERGCHTAIMGIETANDTTLKTLKKGFTTEDTKRAFQVLREVGISTVGTAIVGLPGEAADDIRKSINFVCKLDPDYLSVHTAIPRSGTELRKTMVNQGIVSSDVEFMDQSGETNSLSSDTLSAQEIKRLHREFTLRFYLRPRYLYKTAWRLLHNPAQLIEHIHQGFTLIKKNK